MGPCMAYVFSSITNEMQRYTIYLFLLNALHVSVGSPAHHQELKNSMYSIGYFVKSLPLPATLVEQMENLFHCNGRDVPSLPLQWQVTVEF